MKNFSDYEIEDYLNDPTFREWVLKGAFRQDDAAWSKRLINNPEQMEIAQQVRRLILAMSVGDENLPDGFVDRIIDNTLRKIRDADQPVPFSQRYWLRPLMIAASIALLVVCGLWYSGQKGPIRRDLSQHIPGPAMIHKINNTKDVIPVALPDGSSVLLQPESKISYPDHFDNEQRNVYLSGQAFFEVTKDPKKPFYVYANELVTRVVGTSFTVSAFENKSSFMVIVKSGKVNVTAKHNKNDNRAAPAIDLIPNQQVIFDRKELSLVRSRVTPSVMPLSIPTTENFYTFNDTPVTDIFKKLSKQYGVKIYADEKLLADCALNTTLMDEPLFVKLKVICEAIGPGTSFNVTKDRIIINSKGCNH